MTSDVRIARKKPKRVARGDRRDSCQAPTSFSSCLYGAIHGLILSHSFDFSRAILVNFSRRAAPKRDSFSCRCSALDPAPPPPPRAPVSAMGQNVVHIDPPATRPRFHNVEPRSREARLAIRDKDMLEKLRLEHRLKSNVKEDLNSNLLEPPQTPRGSSPRRTASARTLRGRSTRRGTGKSSRERCVDGVSHRAKHGTTHSSVVLPPPNGAAALARAADRRRRREDARVARSRDLTSGIRVVATFSYSHSGLHRASPRA